MSTLQMNLEMMAGKQSHWIINYTVPCKGIDVINKFLLSLATLSVRPDKNRQMSIKVAQKWFN